MRFIHLLALTLLLAACSSSEENELTRLEDFYRRARQYYDVGDLPRAQQQASMGLALEPDHPKLNLVMGRTLLQWRDLKHVAAAREYLEKAHDLDPDYRTTYSLGEYHLRYAEFLLGESAILEARLEEMAGEEGESLADMKTRAETAQGKAEDHLNQAEEFLSETSTAIPDDRFTMRLLANCYTHMERTDEALEVLQKLISELQRSRRYKNERLALQELNLPQEDALRQALRADMDMEIQARGLASTIYLDSKRYPEAVQELTAILNLNPELSHEYFNRGMCYYWLGDLSSAAEDMQVFVRKTDRQIESKEVSQALDIIQAYKNRRNVPLAEEATPTQG
ncbi:MAG: hypothetical protein DWQ01_07970 [Planctomycetota bacterium]|nr:MAG: hypothetical protein DWQ01_07970 [Planctomycetota bacterium]